MPVVKYTPAAKQDLFDIWEWGVDNHGKVQAERFADEIAQTFLKIAAMPYAYIERPKLGEGIRSKPFQKKYTIFYYPIEEGIVVVRVLRGSRDIDIEFSTSGIY
ncbi:MAG: type II toxin-antitoxin system RelE/ParE family toxin [Tunicatimonas sp.]